MVRIVSALCMAELVLVSLLGLAPQSREARPLSSRADDHGGHGRPRL